MAYNPYSAVNSIYKLKGQWDDADKSGDTTTKNNVAAKAQEYYNQLRNNGYSDVADKLSASNYAQSKSINDKWAKMGKTPTRDYLSSLGKSYGMTTDDVDKLIGWDNQTGEVSFGGKKIGTPDAVVDGVSYWTDTSVLDSAFNDYINRSGTTYNSGINDKIGQLWKTQNNDHSELSNMYKQEYEDIKKTNPFTTEEAQAILGKYSLAGLQARDNAVASGGASNGGNIDSYSATNAMRQQASLLNQGQMKVLNAHQQKLDNARAILEGLGVYQQNNYKTMQDTIGVQQTEDQRLFENDEIAKANEFNRNETSKNNDVARKSEIASVTGYAPDEWVVSNNPYMNDDGTIKDQYKNVDFSAVMANAKKTGNEKAYNAAAVARYYKIMGDYETYGQYDDGNYAIPGQQETEARRQANMNNDTVLKTLGAETDLAKYEINTKKTMADNENATNLYIAQTKANSDGSSSSTLTGSQARTALKDGEISESILKAYNDAYGTSYTMENPPPVYDGTKSKSLADQWMKKLNDEIADKYGSEFTAIDKTGTTFKRGNVDADFIILRILDSDELTLEEKESLLDAFGISDSEINTVYKDSHYR